MSFEIEKQEMDDLQILVLTLWQWENRLKEFLSNLPSLDSEILKPRIEFNNNEKSDTNFALVELAEKTIEIGFEIDVLLRQMKTAFVLTGAKTSSDMKSTVREQLLVCKYVHTNIRII